jgi:hypothetical protein
VTQWLAARQHRALTLASQYLAGLLQEQLSRIKAECRRRPLLMELLPLLEIKVLKQAPLRNETMCY